MRLNQWTLDADVGVEARLGMRVRRCPSWLTDAEEKLGLRHMMGTVETLGTDGGSELRVRWDNGLTSPHVKAGKRGNCYEIMTA